MRRYAIHLCQTDSCSHLKGRERTYENVKRAVLEAGRYSEFDVVTSTDAAIFTRLLADPELEITKQTYPWTEVRKKGRKNERR